MRIELFDPNTILGALLSGAIFLLVGLILSWVLRYAVGAALRHDQSDRIDQITLSFLSHLAVLVMWVILIVAYTRVVPALNRFGTALLAGVSLVSVVIGFAAQTTLGNLVAGISLVLYKPFRRGDRIQISAPTKDDFDVGVVEDISLGFTVLRTDDGRRIIVANGKMAQQTMIKLSPTDEQPIAPAPPV
ncbi:mechanosensitive ion channel family protein [Sphingomonas sp. MMSM20]|uniref:mechanosensitive ion channel family protein n=1 Tax=Sphingomonas lycopersici TaxID=2951807 RepID=UPI0022375F47|nr:mechanosensitive ion channel family protein [Sphingomonas lycopersici]MCW6528668.1 mechanosensitive ion channel family protein [Sphingomonas lycopersici]MDF2389323.1 mechanosensitive ion channel [Nostoc ellipsosporum NOK]